MYIKSIRVDALTGEYWAQLPAVKALAGLERLRLESPVTFFVGENGSGKSTLLEAIATAWGFNPEGGTRNFNFATKATHSGLHEAIRLARGPLRPSDGFFLRAESFYNVSTEIEALDKHKGRLPPLHTYYGGPLHECSHGEAFLRLVTHRFGGNGLYILDEPEAALSPTRQLSLLARFHALVQNGSQLIVSTHSPLLMAYPGAQIFKLSKQGLAQVAYEETEHYQVTRSFLQDPARMLRILFEEE